jgi:hypothetical protein
MLRILRPTGGDPTLNRKITVVRSLFLLLALGVVALLILLALRGEMPDMVPSTSRRTAGAAVTWEASPLEFIIRFLLGLLGGLAAVGYFGILVEKFVVRRHGARPLFRKRYPY